MILYFWHQMYNIGVCNPTMTPDVQCLRYLVPLRHVFTLLITSEHQMCNLLGYWWHRSVCYASLFPTSLVVTTISVYNVLWPSDVVSLSGPLISSLFSVRWSLFSVSLLCVFISESYVTTDGQSASLSWYKAPIRGLRPDFYYRTEYGIRLTVTFLIPWGALSDERTGLPFVCAAGPCQRSLSRCLSPLKSSDCAWNRRRLPQRFYFPLLRFSNNLVAWEFLTVKFVPCIWKIVA
jgi:hypothetical protein